MRVALNVYFSQNQSAMGIIFKKYKMKFRHALKPLFAMLVAREKTLSRQEWIEMVNRSRMAVNSNPVEYLGNDLPHADLLRDVLEDLFQEFLKERAFHSATVERNLFSKIFNG